MGITVVKGKLHISFLSRRSPKTQKEQTVPHQGTVCKPFNIQKRLFPFGMDDDLSLGDGLVEVVFINDRF